MRKKQIAVIAVAVVVTGYLYFLPVKPLALAKAADRGTGKVASATDRPSVTISVNMVSATAKSVPSHILMRRLWRRSRMR
jgi:hypothetical protein